MQQDLIKSFTEHVHKSPNAIAIVVGEKNYTYQQLHDCSSQLAHRLSKSGSLHGDIVALFGDRSLEWVVGMLAILKIGAIYLPLHPELPLARRKLLLREAGVKHVLLNPHIHNDIEDEYTTLSIDTREISSLEPSINEHSCFQTKSSDRACVLFTSGTTGTPKGVVVRQSSILNLVLDTNYIALTETDRVAFASNTAFDAATFEVWGALLNGGCIVVIPPDTLLSPVLLEVTIRKQGISTLFLTTALFNAIARNYPTALGDLKWLLFGGEDANSDCVRRILYCDHPPANLVHVYGPTECTTFSTFYPVRTLGPEAEKIPIGRPIKGCGVHVLDHQFRPTPLGNEGELCISGDGLAEGYLGCSKADSTAFRSIAIDGINTMIYCTGDRVKLHTDGQLEYIGRRDSQIKLRGFRIETSEIESILRDHHAIIDAIVLVYPGPSGAPRLGAAIQSTADNISRVISELYRMTETELPDQMRPTRIRAYRSFPLTPSKKIDRQRLCSELGEEHDQTKQKETRKEWLPNTKLESRLAKIWKEVLGRFPTDLSDNFFDAGGDSLQALTMQVLIERQWKTILPPSFLLEHTTFSSIASYLTRSRPADIQPVVWLTSNQSRPVMACIPGVYGHVFSYRNLLPFWPKGKGLCALPSRYLRDERGCRLLSMEELARECIDSLRGVGVTTLDAISGYSFGGLLAYEIACQIAEEGKRPPSLIIYDALALKEETRGLGRRTRVRLELTHRLFQQFQKYQVQLPFIPLSASTANFTAVRWYRPRPFPGSMLLIRASVASIPTAVDVETLGWGELVRGRLTVHSVDADHANLLRPPHVAEITEKTVSYLREQSERWR